MAIYHLHAQILSRKTGRSSTAAAAYRSATRIVDERTGEIFDFTRKQGVLDSGIVMPTDCPWQPTRDELWNAVEAKNKRADAQVAREVLVALPHELSEGENRVLVREFAQRLADDYCLGVDYAIHAPDHQGDDRNVHAHILITTNRIEKDGRLGNKAREFDGIAHAIAHAADAQRGEKKANVIDDLREEWSRLANAHLERAGLAERIDHRSYAGQGVALTPTTHIGVEAVGMGRRGVEAERLDIHGEDRQEQADQIRSRPDVLLDKITATRAVFTRRDMAVELNRYIDDPSEFQIVLAQLEQSVRLVEMEPANGRLPAKYSTREMIDAERAMADSAERMAGASRHAVPERFVAEAIERAGTLSTEQANAVRHVTGSSAVAAIIGDAGTGKSFSMRIAKEAWEGAGYSVRGAAMAGKAADELQAGSGIESRTLASLEYGWKEGRNLLTARDVLVVDEAGMVGSRQLGRVLAAAEAAGAKVVLLGDDKQLAAIEAGAAFRAVVENVGAAEITEVRRQKEAWAREAGQEFARGSVAAGIQAYADRGHVQMLDSREAAVTALASSYVADMQRGSQIVLAHSNKDVLALNDAIRQARKERGELGDGAAFSAEKGAREFAAGDRIVFLRNDRQLGVKNGTLGTVERSSTGVLSVKLDSGESLRVAADNYNAVDHGYAVTVHKAQGVTVDHAYLLATPGMDRSLTYVGMTRHRHEATMFAGADDFAGRSGGVLVDHGRAPYENDSSQRMSYFVTLSDDKGEKRTVWGVDFERAIADSGVNRGDRMTLQHVGAESVTLPDGTQAHRNGWKVANSQEAALTALVKTLGRERQKESTLDFADRRGFDGEQVVRRLIERGRAKLAELADRAEKVVRKVLARAGREDLVPSMAEGIASVSRPASTRAASPLKTVMVELLEDYAQAWQAKARATRAGGAHLATANAAVEQLEGRLDKLQPGAVRQLQSALAHDANLARALAGGGERVGHRLSEALQTERALRADPVAFAARTARVWHELETSWAQSSTDPAAQKRVQQQLSALTKVVSTDKQLTAQLRHDAVALGIKDGSLERVMSKVEAERRARDQDQEPRR